MTQEPVFIKFSEGKTNQDILLELFVCRDGEFIDVDKLEADEPCGMHAIYAKILINALNSDPKLKGYMEFLLADFAKFLQAQCDKENNNVEGNNDTNRTDV